jgi:hypothetical protein
VIDGLNLIGICLNRNCKAFNLTVAINKGIGTFDISYEKYNSYCPACKERVTYVNNLCFLNCFYDIEGSKKCNGKEKIEIRNKEVSGE